MATSTRVQTGQVQTPLRGHVGPGLFIMTLLLLVFGIYIIYPVFLLFLNSFNMATVGQPPDWSLDNWRTAFSRPQILRSLGNTLFLYAIYTAISFPIATLIAWVLARTNVWWSHRLEFMFWLAFMVPTLASTVGWTFLLDPYVGFFNYAITKLPFVDRSPFNIYSVPGIIFAHLVANAIAIKVMLLTPAFRNMNVILEEAARVSGASNLRTIIRVTIPVMVPSLIIVLSIGMVRMFQSFEIEQMLGTSIGFYVYSTEIYRLVRTDFPQYGQATALASLTLALIAVIIPIQQWLTTRRQYTTVSGQFRSGLIDIGKWQPVAFVLVGGLAATILVVPIMTLLGGSFMTRLGFFTINPLFTLNHWESVFSNRLILRAIRTTLILALSSAVIAPLIFSVVAYVITRTTWPGRRLLDSLIWLSAAIPGILSGLGLLWFFLGTPFLSAIFGTIWALLIVTVFGGMLLSTQMLKSIYLQMGKDIEEAARISGANWFYAYFRIWLPLIMPTLIMVGTINFVLAAQATSTIILLASRDTTTLSLLVLQMMTASDTTDLEAAGILSLLIIAMTVGVALIARRFGSRMSTLHG